MKEIDLDIHRFTLDLHRKSRLFEVYDVTSQLAALKDFPVMPELVKNAKRRLELGLGRLVAIQRLSASDEEARRAISMISDTVNGYPARIVREVIAKGFYDNTGHCVAERQDQITAMALLHFLERTSLLRDSTFKVENGKVLKTR